MHIRRTPYHSLRGPSRLIYLACQRRWSFGLAPQTVTRSPYIDDEVVESMTRGPPSPYHPPPDEATSTLLPGFTVLGVKPAIARGVHQSFPEIQWPTSCQAELIPAVMSGEDVLLRDRTGSGKSFGLLLALLSKLSRRSLDPRAPTAQSAPASTALIIVPHQNLALQMQHWTRQLMPTDLFPDLSAVISVILRSPTLPSIAEQALAIRQNPPHIILGTPHALLDLAEADWAALGVPRLGTIAVDEADALLALPGRFAPRKERRAFTKHPPPALSLLKAIFEERPKRRSSQSPATSSDVRGLSLPRLPPIQLILMSATLNSTVRGYLMRETEWLSRNFIKLDYAGNRQVHGSKQENKVRHICLVVGDKGVRNISCAEEDYTGRSDPPSTAEGATDEIDLPSLTPDEMDDMLFEQEGGSDAAEGGETPPSPFNPALLEAIATTIAMDVPRLALFFCPAAASVQRVVDAFVALGVRAQPLELADGSDLAGKKEEPASDLSDEPRLLVATDPGSRGIDLPQLSHVFMLGLPKDPVSYVHMSGRVGRLGRPGTAVVVLTDSEKPWEMDQQQFGGGAGALWGEEKTMTAMYKVLNVTPTRFQYVV